MQSLVKSFIGKASLVGGGATRRLIPRVAGSRQFTSEVEVKNDKNTSVDIDSINKKLGVDTVFSQ